MLLTRAQIDEFHQNGFLHIPGVFSGRELELMQQASEDVIADGIAGRGEGHVTKKIGDSPPSYWRTDRIWNREAIWKAATANPTLLAIIGQCQGLPFIPFNEALVTKLPGSGTPVAFHQDPPYGFSTTRDPGRCPVPNFTVDIYLDRSTLDNGCVWAIPGQHLIGRADLKDADQDALFAKAVPLETEPGDVLFHSLGAPHGSKENTSDDRRRTFYLLYVAQEMYDEWFSDEMWRDHGTRWDEAPKLIASLIEAREELGLGTASEGVVIEDGVFRFVGEPSTPPRHWASL